MKIALAMLGSTGCFLGADVRAGVRPTGKSPEAEGAASFALGGVVKGDQWRQVSLGATFDSAGFTGYPRGLYSGGLTARYEQRASVGIGYRRFSMWLVQLHGAIGAELRDDDEGSIQPSASLLVGYGRGWRMYDDQRSASWHVGLTVSRASLDDGGGAWFVGIGVGLRIGFWEDGLDEDSR